MMGNGQELSEHGEDLVKSLRRERRISVAWPAQLRVEGNAVDCQILNISMNGAKVQLDGELEPGTTVEIVIEEFHPLSGRVVWSMPDRAGIVLSSNPDTIRATLFSRARLEE